MKQIFAGLTAFLIVMSCLTVPTILVYKTTNSYVISTVVHMILGLILCEIVKAADEEFGKGP